MRKTKIRPKIFMRSFAAIFLLIVIFAFIFFGCNSGLYKIGFLTKELTQPVVLELLHIESFEGGSASRTGYLQNMVRDFNKQNPDKFVNIRTMTAEQFELNENLMADLISFGVGAGDKIRDRLIPTELNFNVRSDLLEYGNFEGEQLAVPYMLGGYAIISRSDYISKTQKDSIFEQGFDVGKRHVFGVGMGMSSLINPAQALVENGFDGSGQFVDGTTYEVYEQFLKGNFCNLVGTQRDVYRMKNRENLGSFVSCEYNFLGGFSDLVQYIGFLKQSTVAELFIKFLLGQEAQNAIKNIGMFSVNSKIYVSGYMCDFEKVLAHTLDSVSAFISQSEMEQRKQQNLETLSVSAYNG